MEHLGSLDELGRASVEEIMAVRNMNRDVAERDPQPLPGPGNPE